RRPVSRGPSGRTWPRWLPQFAECTTVRVIPWVLSTVSSTDPFTGTAKLDQPLRLSTVIRESNSAPPRPACGKVATRFIRTWEQGAGVRSFGPVPAHHLILLGRQLLSPLLVSKLIRKGLGLSGH